MSTHSRCLILIQACGPNVSYLNLKDTIESLILRNRDEIQIQFVFVVDDNKYSQYIKEIFSLLKSQHLVLDILNNKLPWAVNSNSTIEKYISNFEFFLFSHDDLLIETEHYLQTSIKFIQSLDFPIGWVTFTSTGYYALKNPVSNSVRTGFFQDRFNFPNVFECAPFKDFQKTSLILPDIPVYSHAPYSHLNLISSKSLGIIGEFPTWSEYTILLDEDQGLRALSNNLPNIWIPKIAYQHPLRSKSRNIQGVRFEKESHRQFRKRWGISDFPYSARDVEYSLNNYGSLFNWSVGKNTFDWSFVNPKRCELII